MTYGQAEIFDMILSRYDKKFFEFKLSLGNKLIKKAFYNIKKDQIFTLWSNCYPSMGSSNFIPFEEFLNKNLGNPSISKRSNEEILKIGKEIEEKIKNRNKV